MMRFVLFFQRPPVIGGMIPFRIFSEQEYDARSKPIHDEFKEVLRGDWEAIRRHLEAGERFTLTEYLWTHALRVRGKLERQEKAHTSANPTAPA